MERRTYPEVPPRVEYGADREGSRPRPADRGHARLRPALALEWQPAARDRRRCLALKQVTATRVAGQERFVPARSLRACATWLLQRPCRRWRGMRRSASASWLATGHEIPYDVQEPGNGSPLPRYVPLTQRFVRDHAPALLELDSFGSACAAIESADLAGPYLEEFGIRSRLTGASAPSWRGRCSCAACGTDSTDFSLDGDRLTEAIAELEAGGETRDDEIEVVVPLRGLQMPVVRLELATATIVRADTVEVPAEARTSEGTGAAGWEPTFLAAARISAATTPRKRQRGTRTPAPVPSQAFRQLITALRLFQAGGVGLGPYAWTRAGADRWRRIATGAGGPRRGGYRLDRGRARRPDNALPRARLPLDGVRSTGADGPGRQARWRARSPASRRAWSETSCWRR